MTLQIAFLRAINVSGHNMIKMSDLKRLFESLGFARVQTYIQSGNVLFVSDRAVDHLRGEIESAIQSTFGLTVPVVLRTAQQLTRIVTDCPFHPDEIAGATAFHVSLLAQAPSAEGLARLPAGEIGGDRFRLVGREIYMLYQQSSHKSKLSNQFFEQRLKQVATNRNWRTITTLAGMVRVPDAQDQA